MSSSITTDVVRTSKTQSGLMPRLREIARYRELLVNLVRKELKVRYKNSVLGFLWTLVNPAITIAVFYVIFSIVFRNPTPKFALFLMSGVLVWNMFNNGLAAAVGSVVGNAPLVKKVWFPREILPLAAVGAALVDFFLQFFVLIITFAAFRWHVGWGYLPLVPLALIVALLFTTALALWLAAVNVRYRDTQHFLGIALMVWFWGTPIIYGFRQVADRMPHGWSQLQLANPYTIVVLCFQQALYNKRSFRDPTATTTDAHGHVVAKTVQFLPAHSYGWYLGVLGIVALGSLLLMLYTSAVFRRLEGDFAEAL